MIPVRIIYPASILFLLLITSVVLAAQPPGFRCDVSATGLSFGSYDVFSPFPTDTTATINVDCNIPTQHPDAPLMVTISLSPGNSGSFGQRQMQQGSYRLNYNLYTSASHSTIWGDGGGGSSTLTNAVTKETPWNATIYGRIPPGQDAAVGNYSDLITVTIDW